MRTEFNEPLWVGMDVDAELARLEEEDRVARAEQEKPAPSRRRRPRGLRAALPAMGRGGVTGSPLPA